MLTINPIAVMEILDTGTNRHDSQAGHEELKYEFLISNIHWYVSRWLLMPGMKTFGNI